MLDLSTLLRHARALLMALLTATLALPTFAQDDPPGRIGRIAWTSGDVYLNNPETGELGAAPLNQPLTSGDVVATGSGSRAEIQIGAMILRLDANTRIEFDRIDDDRVRIRLVDGRLVAKLPTEDSRRDFVLDTGQGRFLPRDTGIYRFDQDGGAATATSYFGTLRFEGRELALDINAGESARLWSDDRGRPDYRMVQGIRDEFTQWSAARDQHQRASTSSRYVSPEMTGAQDLDAYGDWSEAPEYGTVWFPRAVAADWAPFRTGHWAWVAPWGWTWIGHEPWGFAPFHYGRWVRIRGAWAWVPGTRLDRPVYAPALVAWIGSPGAGVSLSIGSGPPVGWFPLAPREVYVPFYRSSPVHIRHVNAPHVRHIHNLNDIVARPHDVVRTTRFVHRHEPHAVSIAPPDAFRNRRPDVRIPPRPADTRDFRDRPIHVAPPAPEPRHAADHDRRTGHDRREHLDAPVPKPIPPTVIGTADGRERPEPQISRRRESESHREREHSRERSSEPVRLSHPPARSEPPMPSAQHAVPLNHPVAVRERAQERPREFQRPPEPHREQRIEARPERREQRSAQPPREERRQERREAREDRREHGHRPG